MRTTVVAGKFDPFHEGHLDHIVKASKLCDYLFVVTHKDESINASIPLYVRKIIITGVLLVHGIPGQVMTSMDTDGKVVKTLEALVPDIFAKGGDRTPDNMPQEEIDICEKMGIEIVYGVGDLLNSSTKIKEKSSG